MFLMRFTERAYVHYTAEDVKNSPNSAVRLTFSNRHFDPQRGADLYNMYLDCGGPLYLHRLRLCV